MCRMDIAPPAPAETTPSETEAERQHRLAQEADRRNPERAEELRRLTLEGLADVDAGRLIDDAAMRAWADSLGTEHELPASQPG